MLEVVVTLRSHECGSDVLARFDLIELLSKLNHVERQSVLSMITSTKMTLSETIKIVRDFVIFLESGSSNAIEQKRISAKTKMLDDLFSVFTKIQNIVEEMIKHHKFFQDLSRPMPQHLKVRHLLLEIDRNAQRIDPHNKNLHGIDMQQNDEKNTLSKSILNRVSKIPEVGLTSFIESRIDRWCKFATLFLHELHSNEDWKLLETIYENLLAKLSEKEFQNLIDEIGSKNSSPQPAQDVEIPFRFFASLINDQEVDARQFSDVVLALKLAKKFPLRIFTTTHTINDELELAKTLALYHPMKQQHLLSIFEGLFLSVDQIVRALSERERLIDVRRRLFKIKSQEFTLPNGNKQRQIIRKIYQFVEVCLEKFFEQIKLWITTISLVLKRNSPGYNNDHWIQNIDLARQLEQKILYFLASDQPKIFAVLKESSFDTRELGLLLENYERLRNSSNAHISPSIAHIPRDEYAVKYPFLKQ